MVLLAVAMCVACVVWLNVAGRRSERILYLFQRLILTSSVAKNLDSDDPYLVYSSLSTLEERGSKLGEAKARELLADRSGWVHGALYLAWFGDTESIPYLIKGLRHQYSMGLYPEMARRLQKLTGQDFGPDFVKWHEWWKNTSPDKSFDFDSYLAVMPSRFDHTEPTSYSDLVEFGNHKRFEGDQRSDRKSVV